MPKDQSTLFSQKKQLIEVYRRALLMKADLEELDQLVLSELEKVRGNVRWHEADVVADEQAWQEKLLPTVVRYGALMVPVVCLLVGTYLIGSAAFPIAVAYWQSPDASEELISAIPQDKQLDSTPIVISQIVTQSEATRAAKPSTPKIIDINLDYTNLANWFPGSGSMTQLGEVQVSEDIVYQLDIPSLDITNAKVVQGGTDLNKSLIAFPGTALPGQYGAPVIFGHSVLRQFYNPSEKNSRRYTSIFSTIMTLKKGDEIFITHDGVRYTYVVQEKTEVKPTDVYILNQKYDAKRLKIVTCTPEGTYLRRGVVTAELATAVPL